MPAPTAIPMSAAVSRSYSLSGSFRRALAADDARAARRERVVVGDAIVAIVAIVHVLLVLGDRQVVVIGLDRRKLRPTAAGEVGSPRPDPSHRRGGRDKSPLRLLLNNRQ